MRNFWKEVLTDIGHQMEEAEKKDESKDQTQCFKCEGTVRLAPQIYTPNKNGTFTVRGVCPKGHRVSRFMTRAQIDAIVADLNRVTSRARAKRGGSISQSNENAGQSKPRVLMQGDIVETTVRKDGKVKVNGNIIPLLSDIKMSPTQRVKGYYLGLSGVRAIPA